MLKLLAVLPTPLVAGLVIASDAILADLSIGQPAGMGHL